MMNIHKPDEQDYQGHPHNGRNMTHLWHPKASVSEFPTYPKVILHDSDALMVFVIVRFRLWTVGDIVEIRHGPIGRAHPCLDLVMGAWQREGCSNPQPVNQYELRIQAAQNGEGSHQAP